jgi:copper chaperone CopZ
MSDNSQYTVQGMTCSSCATKVRNAVTQVRGVVATDVDLATGTLQVTGSEVDDAAIRAAITEAGYQVG